MASEIQTKNLKIEGMTCTNCENIIEQALKKTDGIQKAKANYAKGSVFVSFDSTEITVKGIARVLKKAGYAVVLKDSPPAIEKPSFFKVSGVAVILLALYLILREFGFLDILNNFPQAEEGMGYGMLFIIGLLTSVHCVAMCGGINLSQCLPQTQIQETSHKSAALKPSLLYNTGRVVSYTAVGALVGALGSVVSFSGTLKGIIQILAGVFMVIMGLNMLNIFPSLRKLMPRMPKALAGKIYQEKQSGGHTPFFVGLLNGLMPCGPLQAMQIYALSTGSPVKGALSMLVFSLGTVPLMFGLGALSSVLSKRFTAKVMSIGAALVVILGISMLGNGFSLSGVSFIPQAKSDNQTGILIENGVQIVNTTVSPRGYEDITVQAGTPVKWTISAPEGSLNGCNYAMFIPEYEIQAPLDFGDNVIEFTPTETGTFPYSCWMGMIRSSITVIDPPTSDSALSQVA
ncbi:urease accessory protein UreH domain-containing protein [Scatolibacter rhodanostii]|uniref:urease accessory protein UreH domain-containing protein n=1 Tax=Scatolibacter rhodanostii TaxID=2014781 RepID=UPI000C08BA8B|nr:sulfite exporter TauE/SafE family protein [Scatolibacter rhodanostii]